MIDHITQLLPIDRAEIHTKFGDHNCFSISRYAQMTVDSFSFAKFNHVLRSKMQSAKTNNFLMYVTYIYSYLISNQVILFVHDYSNCKVFGNGYINVTKLISNRLNSEYDISNFSITIQSITAYKKCEFRRNYIKYEINAFAGM